MQFDGGTVARCQAGRHAVTADWRQGVGASILAREPGGPTWAKREQTRGALRGSGRFFAAAQRPIVQRRGPGRPWSKNENRVAEKTQCCELLANNYLRMLLA